MSDRFDDLGHNHVRLRLEMHLGMRLSDPRAAIMLPLDGLPPPLRAVAQRLQQPGLTSEERTAAAKEFLLLSEEWTV